MKALASFAGSLSLSGIAQYLGVGVVVGVMSGLLGVGGGVIMVPVVNILWKQDMKVAVGTSLAAMVPIALVGFLAHNFKNHTCNIPLAAMLAVGAMVGTYWIGAPLSHHLPGPTLKRVFGVILMVFGFYYLYVGPYIIDKLGTR